MLQWWLPGPPPIAHAVGRQAGLPFPLNHSRECAVHSLQREPGYTDITSMISNLDNDRSAIIDLCNVWLRYNADVLALEGVDLRVEQGEFVFLVGSTGSGKSSMLKLINRELVATSGEVWIAGREVRKLRARQIPNQRRMVGVVFQDFRLLPDRTVRENVAFAGHVIGLHPGEVRARTENALRLVGLTHRANNYPSQISGGEQQRTAIARAIVNEPPILIADEPTGSLDPETSWEIMQLLERVNQNGTTILVASHDQLIVDRMKKRVVQIDRGRITRDELEGGYVKGTPALMAPDRLPQLPPRPQRTWYER